MDVYHNEPENFISYTEYFRQYHMDFDFYNLNSIQGFNSIFTLVCAMTINLWVLPTASKTDPVRIIRFNLTAMECHVL